nr:ribosomal protein L30 {N-terminal} [Burkholderia pickettii, Peptide Partial, 17 aa] [Ralstonia pickettii]
SQKTVKVQLVRSLIGTR